MLHDALDLCTDGPAAIRWAKTAAPSVGPDEVGHGLQGRLVRRGTEVCLIGVGKMLAAAQEAAELLEAEGVSVTVWDPRVVKPFDPNMIDDALEHPIVVTIEDGLKDGGVGSAFADELRSRSDGAGPKIAVLGVPDRYLLHAKPDAILAELGLDAAGVAASVRSLR